MKCIFSNEECGSGMDIHPNRCFLSLKAEIECDGNKDKKGCPLWANSQK